jgi:hypothetical protein
MVISATGSGTEPLARRMARRIYCGVPAGVDASRNAREVFAELDRK